MNASAHGPCVDPAVLGAVLDGTLAPERAAAVTRHLTRCAECRTLLARAAEVEHDIERARAWRTWSLAAAAVIAVVLLAAYPYLFKRRPGADDAIARLVRESPRTARTVDGRIAGFPWAPPPPLRRASGAEKTPEQLALSGVAASILRELGNDPSPGSLHARGVALLLAGDAAGAVPLLEQASRLRPDDARVWNELAAAYYAAAKPDDRRMLQQGLDAAARAIQLDSRMAEPRFNRALLLERMGTSREAAEAWRDYLRLDGQGAWAAEARRHLSETAGATE